MIIYKITNTINGKAYVGQTTRTLAERFTQHKGHCDTAIGGAIQKYGADKFTAEVLEKCETVEQLNEREKHWIATLNTLAPNGYNLTTGGDRFHNAYTDPKLRKRIAETLTGRTLTVEQRAKISAGLKKYYSDPENLKELCEIRQRQYTPELRAQRARESTGRRHTAETRAKQSAAAKRRAQTPEGRAHLLAMSAKAKALATAKRLDQVNQQHNDKGEQ